MQLHRRRLQADRPPGCHTHCCYVQLCCGRDQLCPCYQVPTARRASTHRPFPRPSPAHLQVRLHRLHNRAQHHPSKQQSAAKSARWSWGLSRQAQGSMIRERGCASGSPSLPAAPVEQACAMRWRLGAAFAVRASSAVLRLPSPPAHSPPLRLSRPPHTHPRRVQATGNSRSMAAACSPSCSLAPRQVGQHTTRWSCPRPAAWPGPDDPALCACRLGSRRGRRQGQPVSVVTLRLACISPSAPACCSCDPAAGRPSPHPAILLPAARLAVQQHPSYQRASGSSCSSRVVCAAGTGGNVIDRPSVLPGQDKR